MVPLGKYYNNYLFSICSTSHWWMINFPCLSLHPFQMRMCDMYDLPRLARTRHFDFLTAGRNSKLTRKLGWP
jgi:hypothetical protein